ncbi:MAG: hypothetical protein IT324_07735 [Anaerolineae bacterium]|nr:hypothetical protein [Anaerolineae bacterium]
MNKPRRPRRILTLLSLTILLIFLPQWSLPVFARLLNNWDRIKNSQDEHVLITETGDDIVTNEVTVHIDNCIGTTTKDVRNSLGLAVGYFTYQVEGPFQNEAVKFLLGQQYGTHPRAVALADFKAPPGTFMEFTYTYTDQRWMGSITSPAALGTGRYTVLKRLDSTTTSRNLGCLI